MMTCNGVGRWRGLCFNEMCKIVSLLLLKFVILFGQLLVPHTRLNLLGCARTTTLFQQFLLPRDAYNSPRTFCKHQGAHGIVVGIYKWDEMGRGACAVRANKALLATGAHHKTPGTVSNPKKEIQARLGINTFEVGGTMPEVTNHTMWAEDGHTIFCCCPFQIS